mmetsp:Transcript_23687/g.67470  ORF Transcript_23687/g.67470 Transcript_23687/m.67470 type:complete len:436 (+) Transcript_23687:1326-2633(+)
MSRASLLSQAEHASPSWVGCPEESSRPIAGSAIAHFRASSGLSSTQSRLSLSRSSNCSSVCETNHHMCCGPCFRSRSAELACISYRLQTGGLGRSSMAAKAFGSNVSSRVTMDVPCVSNCLRPARPLICWYSSGVRNLCPWPSNFVRGCRGLKWNTTTLAGMFKPMPNVSVQKSTSRRPCLNRTSVISLANGTTPPWWTPMPLGSNSSVNHLSCSQCSLSSSGIQRSWSLICLRMIAARLGALSPASFASTPEDRSGWARLSQSFFRKQNTMTGLLFCLTRAARSLRRDRGRSSSSACAGLGARESPGLRARSGSPRSAACAARRPPSRNRLCHARTAEAAASMAARSTLPAASRTSRSCCSSSGSAPIGKAKCRRGTGRPRFWTVCTGLPLTWHNHPAKKIGLAMVADRQTMDTPGASRTMLSSHAGPLSESLR